MNLRVIGLCWTMKDRVLRPVNIGTLFLTSKDLCIPDLNFNKLNFNNISRLLSIFNSSTNENIMGSHHLQNMKAFLSTLKKQYIFALEDFRIRPIFVLNNLDESI